MHYMSSSRKRGLQPLHVHNNLLWPIIVATVLLPAGMAVVPMR